MKILVITGSARRESLNTRLAQVVPTVRPVDMVTFADGLDLLPYYNGDVEAAGDPVAVQELRTAVAEADALVVVTPEYNGTVPGMLGNAVDWLSRPPGESVLRDKPVVVLSASPSRYGAVRAAGHLRAVLSNIGADVAPVGLSVPRAHRRFVGGVADRELAAEITRVLAEVLDRAPTPSSEALTLAV